MVDNAVLNTKKFKFLIQYTCTGSLEVEEDTEENENENYTQNDLYQAGDYVQISSNKIFRSNRQHNRNRLNGVSNSTRKSGTGGAMGLKGVSPPGRGGTQYAVDSLKGINREVISYAIQGTENSLFNLDIQNSVDGLPVFDSYDDIKLSTIQYSTLMTVLEKLKFSQCLLQDLESQVISLESSVDAQVGLRFINMNTLTALIR